MARNQKKRLNKKLLLVLLLLGVPILIVVGVAADSRWPWLPNSIRKVLSRDPQSLISKAMEVADQAQEFEADNKVQASQIADPEEAYNRLQELNKEKSEPLWHKAERDLVAAYRYAYKDLELRKKVLKTQEDLYTQRQNYEALVKIWALLAKLDASDYESKRKYADICYESARYGGTQLWADVQHQADELSKMRPEDPHGYILKGHALVMMLTTGATEDPAKTRDEAQQLLEKALQLDDTNVMAYRLQAELAMYQAKSSDNENDKMKYRQTAQEALQQAVDKNPKDVEAYLNLLEVYATVQLQEKMGLVNQYTIEVAQKAASENRTNVDTTALTPATPELTAKLEQAKQQAQEIIRQYLQMVDEGQKKFPQEARLYVAKANIKESEIKTAEDYTEPMELYRQAIKCDPEKALWYIQLARLYRQRSEMSDNPVADLEQGLEILRKSRYLPRVVRMMGPQIRMMRAARLEIDIILVDISTALAVRTATPEDKERYLKIANSALQSVRGALGEDQFYTKLCAGYVALAEDRLEEGIKDLYEVDRIYDMNEQYRQNHELGSRLKMRLFYALRGDQPSMAMSYGEKALALGRYNQQPYLDYMATALSQSGRLHLYGMLNFVAQYQEKFGLKDKYNQQVLNMQATALLRLRRFAEAQKIIAQLEGDSYELKRLQAMSQVDVLKRVEEMAKLVKDHPADKELVNNLFAYYMSRGGEDQAYYDQARSLIKAANEAKPDSEDFQRMQMILGEGNPGKISIERQNELKLEIIKNITDPFDQAIQLGDFYQQQAMRQTTSEQEETIKTGLEKARENYAKAVELKKDDVNTLTKLFDTVLMLKDWEEAKRLIGIVKGIDPLSGLRFEVGLAIAKEDWETGLDRLEKILDERPTSVIPRINLAMIYARMGRLNDAIEQAEIAVTQDRSNESANTVLARLRHSRNLKIGLNQLSEDQTRDVLIPVDMALSVRPQDLEMLRLRAVYYSLFINKLTERLKTAENIQPAQKALWRQRITNLQETAEQTCRYIIMIEPKNLDNQIMLANVLYNYAQQVDNPQERQELMAQTEEVYKDNLQKNPESSEMAAAYVSFLNNEGRSGDVEKMLASMDQSTSETVKIQAKIGISDLYTRQGDYNKSREILLEVLQQNPDNNTAKEKLAYVLTMLNKFDEAIEIYQKLRQENDSERLITQQIETLLSGGKLDEAAQLTQEMRQKYPDSIYAKLISARVNLRKSDYQGAMAYADEVLANNSQNRLAYLIKAEALSYSDQLPQAIDCLNTLRGTLPGDSNFGRIQLAQLYWRSGRYDDAINELKSAIVNQPDDEQVRNGLINMLRLRGRWDELDHLYAESIARYPENVGLYLQAADNNLQQAGQLLQQSQARRAQIQYDKALELMRKGWQKSQQIGNSQQAALDGLLRVLLVGGKFYNQPQNYAEVLNLVDNHTKGQPTDAPIILRKAEALYQMNRNPEALKLYEDTLNTAADNPALTKFILGRVFDMANTDDLLAWAQKKVTEHPEWTGMHMILANLYRNKNENEPEIAELLTAQKSADEKFSLQIEGFLAMAYYRTGQKEKMIESCRKMLQTNPEDYVILNNLAYILMEEAGYEKEAVEMANKAYHLASNNPDVMDTYALALIQVKDYAKAELLLRQAIQQILRDSNKTKVEYQYHLAQALKGQNRLEDARQILRKELENLSLDTGSAAGDTDWKNKINQLLEECNKTN